MNGNDEFNSHAEVGHRHLHPPLTGFLSRNLTCWDSASLHPSLRSFAFSICSEVMQEVYLPSINPKCGRTTAAGGNAHPRQPIQKCCPNHPGPANLLRVRLPSRQCPGRPNRPPNARLVRGNPPSNNGHVAWRNQTRTRACRPELDSRCRSPVERGQGGGSEVEWASMSDRQRRRRSTGVRPQPMNSKRGGLALKALEQRKP